MDCHTNVVGGLTLAEPATDLAVALAIAASYFERPVPRDAVAIGEIGALVAFHVAFLGTQLCLA